MLGLQLQDDDDAQTIAQAVANQPQPRAQEPISQADKDFLLATTNELEVDMQKFLAYLRLPTVDKMTYEYYAFAMRLLAVKADKKGRRDLSETLKKVATEAEKRAKK